MANKTATTPIGDAFRERGNQSGSNSTRELFNEIADVFDKFAASKDVQEPAKESVPTA